MRKRGFWFATFGYIFFQIILLIILRKVYVLTSYQTVLIYGVLSFFGMITACLYKDEPKKSRVRFFDAYLVSWSGIHGVILLNFLTYGTFYLTLTKITLVQIVELFLGMALFWIIYIISGKVTVAIGFGNLVIGIWGTINNYLVRLRGTPFQITDIKAAKTAINVVTNYDLSPNLFLVIAVIDLLVWFILWRKWEKRNCQTIVHPNLWNPINIFGTVVILIGCILLKIGHFEQIYAETQQFVKSSYLTDLFIEIIGIREVFPEDYSVENIRDIANTFYGSGSDISNKKKHTKKPHIITIMNESFSDLRVLGDFETTEPVLEYWDSLKKNVIRGWANVSVLGGTTANSEYEFLTSDPIGTYKGAVPYNKYFNDIDDYSSIISVLKEQGYETTAFHPYLSSGWNRDQVYRVMQFDNIYFLDDVDHELETLRSYVSDKADYSYIIEYFKKHKNGMPQMFFNITMQNHGGYTFDNAEFPTTVQLAGNVQGLFPQAEQYLSLVKASDEALRGLLEYFSEYEEPVIIVIFGDHQPQLEEDFYEYVTNKPINTWDLEQKMNQYKTPFIIWHNYNSRFQDIDDVSLNYLAALTLQDAELSMSDYQKYSLRQYERFPVITSLGIISADNKIFGNTSKEYRDLIQEYRMLVYNHTVDKKYHLKEFYNINPIGMY